MGSDVCRPIAANELRGTLACTFCQRMVCPSADDLVHLANVILAHAECAMAAPRRRSRRM
jgi:hypothetical protein